MSNTTHKKEEFFERQMCLSFVFIFLPANRYAFRELAYEYDICCGFECYHVPMHTDSNAGNIFMLLLCFRTRFLNDCLGLSVTPTDGQCVSVDTIGTMPVIGSANCRLESLKSTVMKIGDATRRGRMMRKEAQTNVLELSQALAQVNLDLQAVFTQLR